MKMAGTPCPYLGQIGQPAADQWDANPEMVPDAESKDLDGDKVDDDEAKVFGVGILGILGLLLLL